MLVFLFLTRLVTRHCVMWTFDEKDLKENAPPFLFPKIPFWGFSWIYQKRTKAVFQKQNNKNYSEWTLSKHSTAVMSSLSVERQKSKQKGRKIMCVCVCATRSTDWKNIKSDNIPITNVFRKKKEKRIHLGLIRKKERSTRGLTIHGAERNLCFFVCENNLYVFARRERERKQEQPCVCLDKCFSYLF